MADAYQEFGQDFVQAPNGDILLCSGAVQGEQSVERAVLLCAGDDPFNLTFGAGAPKLIGQPENSAQAQGLVLKALKLMPDVVSQSNAIMVTATQTSTGTLTVNLSYTDVDSGEQVGSTINVGKSS